MATTAFWCLLALSLLANTSGINYGTTEETARNSPTTLYGFTEGKLLEDEMDSQEVETAADDQEINVGVIETIPEDEEKDTTSVTVLEDEDDDATSVTVLEGEDDDTTSVTVLEDEETTDIASETTTMTDLTTISNDESTTEGAADEAITIMNLMPLNDDEVTTKETTSQASTISSQENQQDSEDDELQVVDLNRRNCNHVLVIPRGGSRLVNFKFGAADLGGSGECIIAISSATDNQWALSVSDLRLQTDTEEVLRMVTSKGGVNFTVKTFTGAVPEEARGSQEALIIPDSHVVYLILSFKASSRTPRQSAVSSFNLRAFSYTPTEKMTYPVFHPFSADEVYFTTEHSL